VSDPTVEPAAKPSAKPAAQQPNTITMTDGSKVIVPEGPGFIVRNTAPFSGLYIIDGAEYDIDPQTYAVVTKRPAAMTAGVVCQEL
jgi:hypothetical protein